MTWRLHEEHMSPALETPDDVQRAVKDHKIQTVDLRFTDLPGQWQKVPVSPAALGHDSFERGIDLGAEAPCFEKAGGYGFLAVPDPSTAFRDPFSARPTLVLICNLRDPESGQNYIRDPRSIAQKAEAYLLKTDIGNAANFGVQLEHSFRKSGENDRHAERRSNGSAGAKLRGPGRRASMLSLELLNTMRRQIVETLGTIGIEVEAKIGDTAPGYDSKIGMPFTTLTRMADNVMICKYVLANVADKNGAVVTFEPTSNNSGLGVHQSIWVGEQPLFAGDGYAGTAALLRHYLAGLVEHAPVLLAICAPAAPSNRGQMPGFKAPVKLGHLPPKQSAVSRGLIDLSEARARRIEFLCPDALCNPYLAFAAMLMAGIDGFENRLYNLDPVEPIEKFYRLPAHELAKVPWETGVPNSLKALGSDYAFLLKGDVFPTHVINAQVNDTRA
jgi:glutamine synthetase